MNGRALWARLWRAAPLIAAATTVLLLITGVLIVYSGERSYRAQKADEIGAEAHILASTVVAALTFDDRQAAQNYVDALAVNPEVEAAAVYDGKGQPFAIYRRADALSVPAPAPTIGSSSGDDRIGVTAEVTQGSASLGRVYVRAVLEPLTRRYERYAVIALLVVMAALVTAVLGLAQSALSHINRELSAANVALEAQIAEREKAEEALRQAQKMEAIGQLTGGVAHDFNNILQVILGNLGNVERQLQRRGMTDPSFLERSVRAALRAGDRAAVLTRQLLAFSRRQPLEPRALDVNKLLGGMSDLLHRTLGETVEVEIIMGAGLWQILADANQLESAILNLAVNARDAMPAGGKLTIETANAFLDEAYAALQEDVRPGQFVVVAVSDTGTGMTQEVIGKAFEPFFTTKDIGQGTGLGLSQVYGFIKQSGGHAKIYSELGQGTTIKLYLPRLLGVGGAQEDGVAERTPLRGGAEAILVVEDEADVRGFVVDMLRELGYQVIEATDGREALAAIETRPEIQLLFTDVGLPGSFNGRQLADAALKARPDLKILYTTGYARNAIVHQGRLDPGVELITKPFTYAALAARIRTMFEDAANG
jgi:signal transduction histidine kinase